MKLQAGTVMRFHGTKHGLLLYMRKVQIRAQGSDLLGSARALVVRAQVPCGDRQEQDLSPSFVSRDMQTLRVLVVSCCFFKLGSIARSFVTRVADKALRKHSGHGHHPREVGSSHVRWPHGGAE